MRDKEGNQGRISLSPFLRVWYSNIKIKFPATQETYPSCGTNMLRIGKGILETCHDICVDSHGDIYVAEIVDVDRVQKFVKIS